MDFGYTYNGGIDYYAGSIISTIFTICAIGLVIYGLVTLASYIFRAIGFYTIAKSEGDENAWLAFVPIVRRYQQGQLAEEILLKKKTVKKPGIWLAVLPVAWGILSYLIGMIKGISMAGKMFRYGYLYSYSSYGFDVEDILEGLVGFVVFLVILSMVYQVFYKTLVILVDKTILEKFTTGNMALIHAVFCAFIPLYESICIFVMSRRIAGESKNDYQEYQQDNTADQDGQTQAGANGYSSYAPQRGLFIGESVSVSEASDTDETVKKEQTEDTQEDVKEEIIGEAPDDHVISE